MSFPAVANELAVALSIERALPQDAEAIAVLHAKALPPGWPAGEIAASCCNENRAVLMAIDGLDFCGFAILQFAADEAEILAIAVEEETRRRGVACRLLETALGICEERLISYVYLEVAERNEPALKLYKKHGFSIAGRREGYYHGASPAAENALIMRLDTRARLTQIEARRGAT
jgi:ribosomal-protein-alanine N-acetyltransferase